jgi:hypothetical protein
MFGIPNLQFSRANDGEPHRVERSSTRGSPKRHRAMPWDADGAMPWDGGCRIHHAARIQKGRGDGLMGQQMGTAGGREARGSGATGQRA